MAQSKRHNINNIETVGKKFYVKYLVCLRDKLMLQSILNELGLSYRITEHDAIEFFSNVTNEQHHELMRRLSNSGLILLDEEESTLIDRIIKTVVEVIHYSDSLPKLNFSDLINKHSITGDDSILKIFSDVKGMSVMQFIVTQKIERAKELLLYDDMTLREIAEMLNYKNQQLLSAQFKKVTGLTPSYFLKLKKARLKLINSQSNPTGQESV